MTSHVDRFVIDHLPPQSEWPVMRYELPELQLPAQLNCGVDLLDRAVKQGWGDNVFLRSDAETLTYAQALQRANALAGVLVHHYQLQPGNRVLLRGGNSIAMSIAWFALQKAGLVVVATMPLLRAKELGEIVQKAQISFALCDPALLTEQLAAQAQNPILKTVVALGPNTEVDDVNALIASKPWPTFENCTTDADDPALIAFTSGTTGKAKATVHSHRDVIAACEAWPRHMLKLQASDIVVGSPPLAFTFGLGGLLLFPARAGASIYYPTKPYTPEALVDTINRVQATVCFTAPTFYRQMAPFAKAHGVPSLRITVSAGEALPDATRTLWREATGIEMLDGIGGTEVFHIYLSAVGDEVRHGAIGKVVPGYVAQVVDDDGNPVPPGTVGRLAIQGPTGCKYLDDVRQRDYVKDGWNYPGDSFMMDADGYFYYRARSDDMIITSGYNVAGPEVEDCLLQHPNVAECGVVGKPDAERGMIVKAFVVLREAVSMENEVALKKALQDFVKAQVAPYKYPREVEFVAALPRTETGKIQRHKLRQMEEQKT